MPDWLVYTALVVLLVGTLASLTGLALLLVAAVRLIEGAIAWAISARRRTVLRERLVQQLADPEQRLLPCHNLACGAHMHTPHHPDGAGVLRCEACGTPATADR